MNKKPHFPASPEEEAHLSKTQLKKNALYLQKMGLFLMKHPKKAQKLSLPPSLQDAVHSAQSIGSMGAQKRHMKYLGKLLRELPDEELHQLLSEFDQLQK